MTQSNNVTIDNFYLATVGLWSEIPAIPKDFTYFFESKKSKYYTNSTKTELVRVSNHWGSGIGECNWYLKGYKKRNSYSWRDGKKIGKIYFSNFIDIRIE